MHRDFLVVLIRSLRKSLRPSYQVRSKYLEIFDYLAHRNEPPKLRREWILANFATLSAREMQA